MIQPPAVTESSGEAASQHDIDWLAITPGGHVAGSARIIGLITWRSGGVNLPSAAARAVCERPAIVARAMRGEITGGVTFPSKK
jgi:hypothetical protein